MPQSPILTAIQQLCEDKRIPFESVLETIESAMAAAYRKDFGNRNQNIKIDFDPETGKFKVHDVKIVVEDLPEEPEEEEKAEKKEDIAGAAGQTSVKSKKAKKEKEIAEEAPVLKEGEDVGVGLAPAQEEGEEEKHRFNPKTEIQLKDAREFNPEAQIGDELRIPLDPHNEDEFGRVAAQTAKQVIIQKIREAERDTIFKEYKEQENTVVNGIVQRREGRVVLIDLGRAIAILPQEEQISNERYGPGDRLRLYIKSVEMGAKGPEVIVSRSHSEIVRQLFMTEIPELANGNMEIRAIAREAGSRSKIAVEALLENLDPIGSCVGQRGTRINTIISALGGEKVDIIEYNEAPSAFVSNALAPAKVLNVEVNEKARVALVTVDENQLSLAIGKGGQNVRLAAKLTGWKIDIKAVSGGEEKAVEIPEEGEEKKQEKD